MSIKQIDQLNKKKTYKCAAHQLLKHGVMLVTAKPTGAKMELLLSVRCFLHLHHGGQAPNSTVYINSTSLSKDLAAFITRHFIQIFTFLTAVLPILSFYDTLILQSLCTPQNDMS